MSSIILPLLPVFDDILSHSALLAGASNERNVILNNLEAK